MARKARLRPLKKKYVKRLEAVIDPKTSYEFRTKFDPSGEREALAYAQQKGKKLKFVILYTLFNDAPEARITHTLRGIKAKSHQEAKTLAFRKLKDKGYDVTLRGPPAPRTRAKKNFIEQKPKEDWSAVITEAAKRGGKTKAPRKTTKKQKSFV